MLLFNLGIVVVGFCSIYFLAIGRLILQLETDSKMMGRVMAFWSVAFVGSTAIGGPLIGWISQVFDPRLGLMFGGIAAIFAGFFGVWKLSEVKFNTDQN